MLARTRFLVLKIFNYFLWYIIFPFLAGKFNFFVPNYVPIKVTFIIIISAIMVSILGKNILFFVPIFNNIKNFIFALNLFFIHF